MVHFGNDIKYPNEQHKKHNLQPFFLAEIMKTAKVKVLVLNLKDKIA